MRRPDKTIIDYLVIAICPILIGLMAGALAFFLLDCTYVGRHDERARLITGLFVLATVCIARISIELSKGRAIVYGTLIAAEVYLAADFLAPEARWTVLLIIVVIWFSVHKLTWNCTFIDEQEEDVGRGLLEPDFSQDPEADEAADGSPATLSKKRSLWRHWFNWAYLWRLIAEPEEKRHPPGAWVVYFAVIAVPLFTLAQWMIPPQKQELAMKYVTIYLFSAMGLLAATSLLGLRRYLRRRRAVMPEHTAVAWLALGGVLIVVCICLATILPHPTGTIDQRLVSLRESFTFKEQTDRASRHGTGQDGAAENPDHHPGQGEDPTMQDRSEFEDDSPDGRQPTDQGPETKAKDHASDQTQAKSDEDRSSQSSQSGKSDKKSSRSSQSGQVDQENLKARDADRSRAERDQSNKRPDANSAPERPRTPQIPTGLLTSAAMVFLRWVVLIVALGGVMFWAFKNRQEILAAIREIIASIRSFFANLFGSPDRRERRKRMKAKAQEIVVPRMRFLDLVDPFSTGKAEQMRPQELVKYTFEAVETWAIDCNAAREDNETPREFLLRVERKTRIPPENLRALSEAYSSTTYDTLPDTSEIRTAVLNHLGAIWRNMRSLG